MIVCPMTSYGESDHGIQAGGTSSPVPAVRQGNQPDAAVEAVRAANHRTAADHGARANAAAADGQGKTSPTFIEVLLKPSVLCSFS